MVATKGDWIVSRTGIRERRIAAEHEATSDLAANAAREALAFAGVDPLDVDMIVVGTVTGDTPTPSCAHGDWTPYSPRSPVTFASITRWLTEPREVPEMFR